MDLSKLDLKPMNVLKLSGLALIVLVFLAFLFRLLSPSIPSFLNRSEEAVSSVGMASYGYDVDMRSGKMAPDAYTAGMPQLSVRNVTSPVPPMSGGVAGNQAEAFETKEYNGTIETRDLNATCGTIAGLKARTYVIFEQANQSDHNCAYTFKVERARLEEILAIVKGLEPKDLSENTQTIKRTIDDFTSEVEILEKKKATIEKTLDDATRAYEEITTLATRSQDVASLARIIESKLQIIERLTQERINVNEQLDRLTRGKAEQLDRLEYTYFNLSVYENRFVDGESLKDSWKGAVREFVQDLNRVAQDLTVGLVALFFFAIQWIIYFFIVLIIAKYVWKFAKAIWKS